MLLLIPVKCKPPVSYNGLDIKLVTERLRVECSEHSYVACDKTKKNRCCNKAYIFGLNYDLRQPQQHVL